EEIGAAAVRAAAEPGDGPQLARVDAVRRIGHRALRVRSRSGFLFIRRQRWSLPRGAPPALRKRMHRELRRERSGQPNREVFPRPVERDAEMLEKVCCSPEGLVLPIPIEGDDRYPADQAVLESDLKRDRAISDDMGLACVIC